MPDHLAVLRERRDYLFGRIEAKQRVGWGIEWDERERAALTWAVAQLSRPGLSKAIKDDAPPLPSDTENPYFQASEGATR